MENVILRNRRLVLSVNLVSVTYSLRFISYGGEDEVDLRFIRINKMVAKGNSVLYYIFVDLWHRNKQFSNTGNVIIRPDRLYSLELVENNNVE